MRGTEVGLRAKNGKTKKTGAPACADAPVGEYLPPAAYSGNRQTNLIRIFSLLRAGSDLLFIYNINA
jgi:hypothetical protein